MYSLHLLVISFFLVSKFLNFDRLSRVGEVERTIVKLLKLEAAMSDPLWVMLAGLPPFFERVIPTSASIAATATAVVETLIP